jgi:hypothetical protein
MTISIDQKNAKLEMAPEKTDATAKAVQPGKKPVGVVKKRAIVGIRKARESCPAAPAPGKPFSFLTLRNQVQIIPRDVVDPIADLAFSAADWPMPAPPPGGRALRARGLCPSSAAEVVNYRLQRAAVGYRQAVLPALTCVNCGQDKTMSTAASCNNKKCYESFKRDRFRDFQCNLELKETPKMGVGVFLRENGTRRLLREGQYIGEYIGEVIPLATVAASDYAVDMAESCRIDSGRAGNWTRFINSSCTPNVRMLHCLIGDRNCIVIVTTRNINAGEELFFDYGKDYFCSRGIMCNCPAVPAPH